MPIIKEITRYPDGQRGRTIQLVGSPYFAHHVTKRYKELGLRVIYYSTQPCTTESLATAGLRRIQFKVKGQPTSLGALNHLDAQMKPEYLFGPLE